MPLLRAMLLALVVAAPLHGATVGSLFDGRIPCVAGDGVQSCIGSLTTRIESFDGVPLDVNVRSCRPRRWTGRSRWSWTCTGGASGSLPRRNTRRGRGESLVASALAPAGGPCGKGPCWKVTASGFRYADPKQAATGVRGVSLASRNGAACTLVARGVHAGVPALPLSGPIVAQLRSSDGQCRGHTFLSAKKSSARLWKGSER